MDVYCHPFTSGGQELPIQEAKAAGLITLVTDYSCGTDSAYEHQGGLPLAWNEYREPSTQFIKATTCPNSICERLEEVYNMGETSRLDLIKTGIEYVKKEFSVENTVSKLKHFIKTVELKKEQKKAGQEEKTENKKVSLNELLKDVPLKDRIAVVLPRSAGDVLMANSLMKNLQSLYPNKKIFFVTNPEYYELINDNPFVYKTIPYTESFENLYSLEGQGVHEGLFEIAFLPHCTTQKTYSYTHNGKDKNQFELR